MFAQPMTKIKYLIYLRINKFKVFVFRADYLCVDILCTENKCYRINIANIIIVFNKKIGIFKKILASFCYFSELPEKNV